MIQPEGNRKFENSNMHNSTAMNSCINFTETVDLGLKIEGYIILFLALISLVINSLFLRILKQSTGQLGIDVRSLLFNSLIACIIRSISFVFRGIYILCLIQFGFDRLSINRLSCALVELPYGVATVASILSMLSIGVNRYHVTLPMDRACWNLEKEKSNQGIISMGTKWSIIFVWICGLIFYAILMIGMILDETTVCFCYYPMILRPIFSYASNACFLALEFSILITYSIVYTRNRSMLMQFTLRTRQYSLRQRCKTWTNVRTTRMLLPPAIVHVSLVLLVISGMSPIRDSFASQPDSNKLKFILLMQICVCTDVIAYPLLCVYFNDHFRMEAKNAFRTPCQKVIKSYENSETCESAQKIIVQRGRPRAASTCDTQSTGQGKCTIIDYRLAPDVHEHILQRTWDMKPSIAQ